MTEDEIYNAVLSIDAPNDHCLCYIREVDDIHKNIPDAIACRYIDEDSVNPTHVDHNAQCLLQQLKDEKLPAILDQSNLQKFSIPWTSGGVDPQKHKQYLDLLCNRVYMDVKNLIDKALALRELAITELHQEILHHASFCLSKCESFCGREDILLQIRQFMDSGKQKPLVIYGPSGSGKTTIMAKSALMIREWMGQSCVSVVRFLGTSPSSSTIIDLLVSICTQICKVCSLKVPKFSKMDPVQIIQYFCNQFLHSLQKSLGNDNHLCIFLDSVDQLSPLDKAHSLNWLPKSLPPNVHIVVSMLPEKHDCLKTIRTMLPLQECYIEVGLLPLQIGLEIMEAWLTKMGRTITSRQREILSKAFSFNPQPLYLKMLFHHTQQWHSYTNISETNIATSTPEAIRQFFTNVEDQYGKVLVQKTLGYLTAAKSGLTEPELEDSLSLDNDVLNEVYQYWDPPDKGLLRIPTLLWKRIRYEISDYLVEQHADGKTVFAWYHRQFVETARRMYLGDELTRLSIHQALSEFFEGVWSGEKSKSVTLVHRNLTLDNASRQVAMQPLQFSNEVFNVRKLNELPYHLLFSSQLEKLKSIALCNFEWLNTKLKVTGFQNVMQDFKLSLANINDTDIATLGETISLSANNLMTDGDSLAGQLIGRLKFESHDVVSGHIQILTEQAHHWTTSLSNGKHQLIPCNNCLISPGGPLQTTLSGHPQLIQQVSVSKTHPIMVSSSKGSNCSIFNIWDVQFLPQYVQNIHTLELSDAGTPKFCLENEFLFATSGHTVTAWNCITGERLFSFQTSHEVTSLTVTCSSQYLLLGDVNGSIVCCDRSSGRRVEGQGLEDSVDYIMPLEGGNTVVIASKSGQLGVYNTVLCKHQIIVQAHSSAITCLSTVSHSGNSYVLTASDDKTAKVWVVAGEKLCPVHTLAGHTKTVKCITHAYTDTAIVVTGSLDKNIRIWEAFFSGLCLRTLQGHSDGVWCIATIPSADGHKVVSGSKDDYLKVWDIDTGECLHTLEGHSSWISCVVASMNDVILSGSNDKTIKVWKLRSTRSPPTDRHFAQPECILSTKNGLVVSGAPDAIKIWDISNARCLHTFSCPASSLSVTDDCRYLVSGSKNSAINIWGLTSFSKAHTVNSQFGAVTGLATVDANIYLSAHANGNLALRELFTEKCTIMHGHTSGVKCITLSKDKNVAMSGSYDCTVRVWDISNAKCIAILAGHSKVVWCIAISSNSAYVASGSDDSTVRIWSIRDQCCLRQIFCPDNVKCVAFSLDDSAVIAGAHCSQNQLRAWNTATGDCVTNYTGHSHAVMCIQIVDEKTFVSGSRDGTIRVWDITTGEMLATFDLQSQVKYITLSKSSPEGPSLLAATTKTGPIAILNYW